MAKSDLARASFQVGDVDLMDSRLFGKVDLPPTPFLSELPDSFAKLDANIRGHSSSIDLVETLYLVDALSAKHRAKPSAFRRVGQTALAWECSKSKPVVEQTPYHAKILMKSSTRVLMGRVQCALLKRTG
jgi:hypothetical protein